MSIAPNRVGTIYLRILKTLLVGLLIAWGVLALAVRATTPLLADYRAELAALVSERLATPVTIGALKARWYGFRPLLELHDVTVGEAPETLRARRVALDLALTELFSGTAVEALRITAEGLQLGLVREADGRFHLEGLGMPGTLPADSDAPALPRHVRLIDTRVVWTDRLRERAPMPLDDINILFDRDGEDISIRANLQSGSGRAELAARLRGMPGGTDWNGDSFLRIDNLDLAGLLGAYLPSDYGLTGAHVDLQAWTHWDGALPVHNQGRLTLRDIALRPAAGDALDLSLLAANFTFDRTPGQLLLGLDGLQLATAEHRWPPGRLALRVDSPADGPTRIDLASDYLRLDDLAAIATVHPADEAIGETLNALRPSGELRNTRLRAELGGGAPRWQAAADFSALSTRPWGEIPGIEHVSGALRGNDRNTVVTLDSRDSVVRFNKLFRDPLVLPRLAGRLDFEQSDDGWRLRSERLQADAAHIRTLTRFDLRQTGQDGLFLDLQSDFRDGDAAFASRYYPVAIMGEPLVRWLDRSIKSGRVVQGTALVYGRLEDFAFEDTRSGSFQVVFDTDDIELDYREGWPGIDRLDAHVKFHGNQLDIHGQQGQIYASPIRRVHARIAKLQPVSPIRIRGSIAGPLQDKLRILGEPALRDRFGEFADILRGGGNSALDLDFTIPLDELGDFALDGRLHFAGNRLTLPDWDFAMRDIAGQLDFTLDGLRAKGIRAKTLGAPVEVDVIPLADGTTRVRSRGRFAPADIGRQLGALPLDAASGRAAFVVDVDVPARGAGSGRGNRMTVSSDLRGIAIDLPAPVGKRADERRELRVVVPLGDDGGSGSARYGDRLHARYSADGQRVDLVLGGGQAQLGAQRGVRIAGHVADIDADAWQSALANMPSADDEAPPFDVDLRIARLSSGALQVEDLQLQVQRDANRLHGTLASSMLAGRFEVPRRGDRAPLLVELDHLALRLPEDDDTPPGPIPDPGAGPDPRALPGVDLSIARLQLNEAKLGRLRLQAAATADGLALNRLSLRDGQATADITGGWTQGPDGMRSQLKGALQSDDIGGLLVDLGYSRQLEEAGAEATLDLTWPGGPAQLHRQTLDGRLDVAVGKGRLVELDPGVTRVVGLLNLNALTRRLRLDFSDFYKKGYSFDGIAGGFTFADGAAETDDLRMIGPTGRIDIRGSTDLVAETLDQNVMVTPNLDATLPIAGTIAGGPVAGIAVLVAQRVMNKQVDAINRFDYSLTGPWEQPVVTQLNTGGTLSKLLKPFSGGKTTEPDAAEAAQATEETTATVAGPAGDVAAARETPSEQTGGDEPASSDDDGKQAAVGKTRNPIRGLFNILKKGKPHDQGLPGEAN